MSVPLPAPSKAQVPLADRSEGLQINLAYNEMTVGTNGSVLSREEKAEIRFRHGFCKDCEGAPIQLFSIKKSRLNPLWVTKEPRSVPGECAGGVCYVCHPDKDPNRKNGRRRVVRESSSDPAYTQREEGSLSLQRPPHVLRPHPRTQQVDMNPTSDHSAPMVQSGNASASGSSSSSEESGHPMSPQSSSNSLPKVPLLPADRRMLKTLSPGTAHSNGSHGRKSRPQWSGVYVPEVMLEAANDSRNDDRMKAESPTPSISGDSHDSLEGLGSQHSESSMRDRTMNASMYDIQTQSSATSDSSTSTSMLSPPNTRKTITIQQKQELPPVPQTKSYSDNEITNIIDGLNALVQGLADCGSPELLADILMGALREHKEVASVQAHCLGVIRELCKDSQVNRSAMMTAGISEDVVRALKSNTQDPVVLEHGCSIIWSLGVDNAYRISLIRAGACSPIVKAMKNFVATEPLVRNAIGALRTLSPESEARDMFGSIGASKVVSEAMKIHRGSMVIQRDGCAFLSNCAVNIEKQIVTVVPFEELDAIVQALVHHRQESSVVQGACFALKNYTHEERNCRTLRKCQEVEALILHVVQFARDPISADDASHILERMQVCRIMDESLEEEACSSLQRIMDSQDNTLKTPRSILDFMRNYDWSARVTAFSLQVLQQVVASPEGSSDLFSNSLHQQVIPYCQTFSSNEDVCRASCRFLVSAANSASHQQLLVDAGACQVVFNSLSVGRSDDTIVWNALKALELLLSAKGCYEKFMENMGLVTEVVATHGTNEPIQVLGSSIFSILDQQLR